MLTLSWNNQRKRKQTFQTDSLVSKSKVSRLFVRNHIKSSLSNYLLVAKISNTHWLLLSDVWMKLLSILRARSTSSPAFLSTFTCFGECQVDVLTRYPCSQFPGHCPRHEVASRCREAGNRDQLHRINTFSILSWILETKFLQKVENTERTTFFLPWKRMFHRRLCLVGLCKKVKSIEWLGGTLFYGEQWKLLWLKCDPSETKGPDLSFFLAGFCCMGGQDVFSL